MKFNGSDINKICKRYGITNYTIDNGLVNVNGNVYLKGYVLYELPVRFGIVTGDFNCSNNNLTTLKGSPKEVHGDFWCNYNNLTSLEGAPDLIGGKFKCYNVKVNSIFQSDDPGLIPMFNAIFMDGVDLEKIEYWFGIRNKPLTEDILKNIRKYYEI
jgi:hypothetical protein